MLELTTLRALVERVRPYHPRVDQFHVLCASPLRSAKSPCSRKSARKKAYSGSGGHTSGGLGRVAVEAVVGQHHRKAISRQQLIASVYDFELLEKPIAVIRLDGLEAHKVQEHGLIPNVSQLPLWRFGLQILLFWDVHGMFLNVSILPHLAFRA